MRRLFAFPEVKTRNRDIQQLLATELLVSDCSSYGEFLPLVERQCPSAHSSWVTLTFDIHGEIIIVSSAEQRCPQN